MRTRRILATKLIDDDVARGQVRSAHQFILHNVPTGCWLVVPISHADTPIGLRCVLDLGDGDNTALLGVGEVPAKTPAWIEAMDVSRAPTLLVFPADSNLPAAYAYMMNVVDRAK